MDLKGKTRFAYMGCYLHCKKLQLMNRLNKPENRIHWEDVGLENWFTPTHFAKWKDRLASDWRGLLKLWISERK